MGVSGGIFWKVGVGGHFYGWVGEGEREWVETHFGWMGVGGGEWGWSMVFK